MSVDHKDFIAIYSNVYLDGYCRHLIDEFERLKASGAGHSRQQSENADRHTKEDHQMGINLKALQDSLSQFDGEDVVAIFFDGLQRCYEEYINKYSIIKNNGLIRANAMKMQKTSPGGGYHIWHCEQGGEQHANRVLVYSLYLNTLPEKSAGETEFLYQQRRINPVANSMILWPAAYTHTHRGNVVHGDIDKYIVTGWFCYE